MHPLRLAFVLSIIPLSFIQSIVCIKNLFFSLLLARIPWKIPWTEEPGRLLSMGSLRVGHDWATSLSLFTSMHWRRKWQPTPVFLPGESQGQGSLVGCPVYGVAQGRTRLKWLSSSSSSRIPWYGYNTVCLTVHLLKDIWFVSSLGDIINKTDMNIHVQVFMWT